MWLPFVVSSVCAFIRFLSLADLFLLFCLFCAPSWRRCPLLANSLSVVFCLISLLFSERVPGLIWFDSVYLVIHGWIRSGSVNVR